MQFLGKSGKCVCCSPPPPPTGAGVLDLPSGFSSSYKNKCLADKVVLLPNESNTKQLNMCKGCCDKAARVQESDHGACQFDILKEITVAFPISALPHDLKNVS